MRIRIHAIFGLTLLGGFAPCTTFGADAYSLESIVKDTEHYFTAPLRWDREDWTYFGVTAAVLVTAHEFDDTTRAHFAKGRLALLTGGSQNSLRDALPTVALVTGTFGYATLINDHDGYHETWSLLEAGALSTASGEILKLATGRQRPDVTASPDRWRHGGDSFPSVHASAAFAVGMVFAESGNDEYRWIRRVIGYGIAGATAYIRVRDNDHWLSDTVAGAALGIATARFVLNRREAESAATARYGTWQFGPARGGWMLSYVHAIE